MPIEIVAYPGEVGAHSEEGALALFSDTEHRPLPSIRTVFESVGEFVFYADVEAPAELPVMVDALAALSQNATFTRLLGSFAAAGRK
jgi:prephenate dehydratase